MYKFLKVSYWEEKTNSSREEETVSNVSHFRAKLLGVYRHFDFSLTVFKALERRLNTIMSMRVMNAPIEYDPGNYRIAILRAKRQIAGCEAKMIRCGLIALLADVVRHRWTSGRLALKPDGELATFPVC